MRKVGEVGMTDREKVIKGWETVLSRDPLDAPWDLIDETLAMLKQQEAKEGHWIVLDFCANEGIYCSECHMKIFDRTTKPKKKLSQYCPHCGSRNEQFFMDGKVVFR